MSTKKNSIDQSAQKPSSKTTPLGKSRLQVPSSVSKTQFTTPNSHNYNAVRNILIAEYELAILLINIII